MNAGRNLDALVAKHVMGWSDASIRYHLPYHPSPDNDTGLPAYSTEIDAAWEVADKMGLSVIRHSDVFTAGRWDDHWAYTIMDTNDVVDGYMRHQATAPTAPHAICLAALKAVGVEVTP